MDHAIDHWRRQFRGEARVKDDTDMIDADIAGQQPDPLGRPPEQPAPGQIADKLPIRWDAQERAYVGRKIIRPTSMCRC